MPRHCATRFLGNADAAGERFTAYDPAMKFTLERKAAARLLRQLNRKRTGKRLQAARLRLMASGAHVCAEFDGVVAGTEALVFAEGQCVVPLLAFTELLRSYASRPNLTFEAGDGWLQFGSTRMEAADYSPHVKPPAEFPQLGMDDRWVTGGSKAPPAEQRGDRQGR
jgi:hypothetical protein